MFTHIEPVLSPIKLQLMTEYGEEIQFPFTLQKGKTMRCYLYLSDVKSDDRNTTIFEIEPSLIGITKSGTQTKQDFDSILKK